jgi:hypothetical protein
MMRLKIDETCARHTHSHELAYKARKDNAESDKRMRDIARSTKAQAIGGVHTRANNLPSIIGKFVHKKTRFRRI